MFNQDKINKLEQRIAVLEQQLIDTVQDTKQVIVSALKKNWVTDVQNEAFHSTRIGLCVATDDPFAQGRIQFYLPGLVDKDTPVGGLPWAYPIADFGGFDDSGGFWVPPAGSAVALVFENGDKSSPYYIGTVWNRDRGEAPHNWGYGIPEFDKIHAGHRTGYYVGDNEGKQVFPPGNTNNYNIPDYDDLKNFEKDTEKLKKVVPSHSHNIKTPQKHYIKMDDGNYLCDHSGKMFELGSSGGHRFLMYDDHRHPAAYHYHPKACTPVGQSGDKGSPLECDKPQDCKNTEDKLKNTLFKPASECRSVCGPQTPENNKCELEQSGIYQASISGHVFVMDDKVTQPRHKPEHERALRPFDFGCEDKFHGRMFMKSATGHFIELNDRETEKGIRDGQAVDSENIKARDEKFNGIRFVTALGNSFALNDHTLESRKAGESRGLRAQTTSKHLFEMIDNGNDQQFTDRKSGAEPTAKAKNAYVRLKSGYGLQLLFRDDNKQDGPADNQFIELLAPQKENDKGPHILRMQEAAPGSPGLVFLRVGGIFYGNSTNEWFTTVGTKQKPASKITYVSENDVLKAEKAVVVQSEIEYHFAKKYIILGAGEDCTFENKDNEQGPCYNAIITSRRRFDVHPENGFFVCPYTKYVHVGLENASDRVFASATNPT